MTDSSSLWWLTFTLCLIFISFIIYLFLSTCMGPPLLRAMRSMLSTHYRATSTDGWDRGGVGYREPLGTSSGFESGRGGAEGFEMSSLGRNDDY